MTHRGTAVGAGVLALLAGAALLVVPAAAGVPARGGIGVDFHGRIVALIDGRDPALGAVSREERADLQALYEGVDAPLWLDPASRPTRNMRDAVIVLSHATDDGLDPADYFQDAIARLTPASECAALDPDEIARLDAMVSTGVLRYLRDVHNGRVDPRALGFRLLVPRDHHDFPSQLRAAMRTERIVALAADLRPVLAQYGLLRAMLPTYRALAATGGFAVPRPLARPVHPGDAYADLRVLQHELVAVGDLPGDTSAASAGGRYDGALVDAVKRFQVRHGLGADGVLGKSTIAALRVPMSSRVQQIELALERLRWLPHLGDQRLVLLNIPMFRLWAVDAPIPGGMPAFTMDAIVGRALRTQTPVLAAEMREVIFRPYWNVPASILRHEVLPAIARNPDYLRREDMEIVRGQSDAASAVGLSPGALDGLRRGELRVRQRPGSKNALGLIKFDFPNSADVYMHGTPAQALFARSRRDFSHGCVRVADPVALAEWVLRDRPEWTRDRIVEATIGTDTVHVTLPQSIRVILFYTTAGVMPEDGTIHFAEDIYHHDVRVAQALESLHRHRTE